MHGLQTPTDSFAYPSLALDVDAIIAFLHKCRLAGVGYSLGAKCPHHGAEPGVDFHNIDCSGFVREAVWRGTAGECDNMGDGSVQQHEQIERAGLKVSDLASGYLQDEFVRIAFLRPAGGEPGHVMLIYKGLTLESHGGLGPDRRAWGSRPWMNNCAVFVLGKAVVV